MVVLDVQLPQQEEMKKIEWNKDVPLFHELRQRVRDCGVPREWCVEVMRGSQFLSPDDNAEIIGEQITLRASPITGHIHFATERSLYMDLIGYIENAPLLSSYPAHR